MTISATATEIPLEQMDFTNAWELLKKYYYIRQSDRDAWTELAQDYSNLCKRSGSLGKELALTVLRYLESKSKRRLMYEDQISRSQFYT